MPHVDALIPEAFDAAATAVRQLPISPTRVINGVGALAGLGSRLRDHGDTAFVLTGRQGFASCRDEVAESLERAGVTWQQAVLAQDCCEADLSHLFEILPDAQVLVGIGGGKVMDAAKLLGHRRGLPVITVPTAAATCAAWTALSNVYTPDGQWRFGVPLPTGPAEVLVDYAVIARAPSRLLASGIADTLAKWVESSASVDPASADAMTLAALQMARFLYERLMQIGPEAVAQAREGRLGPELMQAIDLNVQLAGTVGGLGGARCRSVAAHAVCNGLTQVETRRASWHGEKVGFGILVQLILQDRPTPEIQELLAFYREIGLPVTLAELGVAADPETLRNAARFACDPRSSIHLLPTRITPEVLVAAIAEADRLARENRAPTS
jgi:glycerol dehydrogenase-like iron-containing ADH family enzyme